MNLITLLVLAGGTYAIRVSGPLLRDRLVLPAWLTDLLSTAATVLLFALMATAALFDGHRFAGFALPAGVVVGGLLAWRRAPFVVVVLAAAASTAGMRLLGVA